MKPTTQPPPTDVDEPALSDADLGVTAVAVRDIGTPTNMEQLAALRGEAEEVIAARKAIVSTTRRYALQLTNPEDWLLFKARDGSVIGYLQDAGCDRIRDLFGVEVYEVSTPQKIMGDHPGEFHYIITGAGRCRMTRQNVEAIEGGRSSADDFCQGKAGVALDLAVRKAARANLDGNITRKLCGMKSVPLRELEEAWAGSKKKTTDCRLGRGFGTQAERQGARPVEPDQPKDVDAPICDFCQKTMIYRPAGKTNDGKRYEAYWKCPDYQKGGNHSAIEDAKYRKLIAEAAREAGSDGQ